jgi:spermidine synthase
MVGSVEAADVTPGGPLLAWAGLGLLAGAVGLFLLAAGAGTRRGIAVGGALAGLLLGFGTPFLAARRHAARPRRGEPRRPRGGRPARPVARASSPSGATKTTTASVWTCRRRTARFTTSAAAATGAAYGYMGCSGTCRCSAANPEHAMVIAVGTGTTAGAVAAHPDVRRLEIVETSRAVLALAPHFEHVNGRVLATDAHGAIADDRVRVRVDDGRRALLMHAADLDVITLEPLMPYTPAALPFYTREFYELARSRLRDGGVLAQWIPVHAMPVELYAALVRTFLEVFPDGALWFFEQSSVLIGRVGTAKPDAATVTARGRDVQRMMRAAGFMRAPAVTLAWVASGPRIRAVLDDPSKSSEEAVRAAPPGPLSRQVVTDDVPFPEAYPLPRAGLTTSYLSDTLLWLSGLVVPDDDPSGSPALAFAPPQEFAAMHGQARTVLRARAVEALGDAYLVDAGRMAAAAARTGRAELAGASVRRRQQGYANLEDALSTYRELTSGPALGDLHLARRTGILERRLLDGATRDALATLDAAVASGDVSGAREAGDALASRACAVRLGGPERHRPAGGHGAARRGAAADGAVFRGRGGARGRAAGLPVARTPPRPARRRDRPAPGRRPRRVAHGGPARGVRREPAAVCGRRRRGRAAPARSVPAGRLRAAWTGCARAPSCSSRSPRATAR